MFFLRERMFHAILWPALFVAGVFLVRRGIAQRHAKATEEVMK